MTDTPQPPADPAALSARIKSAARDIGFDLVGIAPAVTPTGYHDLLEWIDRGHAGQMHYIPRRRDAYQHPDRVLESARSVVMLALNYLTDDPPPLPANHGRVARYACGQRDYHDVIRDMLRELANVVHQHLPTCRTRGVVDTAPLLERDFARLAGLGWFGKNTMLINKRIGSLFFLAALLTDAELEYDQPHETAHCGTCTRCLDACPTDAFPAPYVLDASRCISYLTIELRDSIPEPLRKAVGDWLFGCDICQDVCPWNRKAPRSAFPAFGSPTPADAIALLSLNQDDFNARFRNSPLSRPGRAGLLRNAAIVLGNCGDSRAIEPLIAALADPEPLLRGAAAWALSHFKDPRARDALKARRLVEDNPSVIHEIETALNPSLSQASPTPDDAKADAASTSNVAQNPQ